MAQNEASKYVMWGYGDHTNPIAESDLTFEEGKALAEELHPQAFLLIPAERDSAREHGGIKSYRMKEDGEYEPCKTAEALQPICPKTLKVVEKDKDR